MFEKPGETEEFLWNQIRTHPDIIGAVWINSRGIHAQALREDFDLRELDVFLRQARRTFLNSPLPIRNGITWLIAYPVIDDAILVLETRKKFNSGDYGPPDDGYPYIFLNPEMGEGGHIIEI